MKIAIIGAGYVGLSMATLLSQRNEVILVDVIKEKVDKINNRISPLKDDMIEEYFKNKTLDLVATTNHSLAYENSQFVIIAVPTNFDEQINQFDTSLIDSILSDLAQMNYQGTIVIKSTISIGYTLHAKEKFKLQNIIFNPEFLRESQALYDNLYPSRIVIGAEEANLSSAQVFANLLSSVALKDDIEVLFMGVREAEAVKLFSNAYLAMRVAFFNELDIFSEIKLLNSRSIIDGVCSDSRIGKHYNNPSFGYGGYCLPKDTKQLLYEYHNVPQDIINAIYKSNETRKKFIVDKIIELTKNTCNCVIGAYRLIMKSHSDNFRNSAIMNIIEMLKKQKKYKIVIFEPNLGVASYYNDMEIINDLDKFKKICNIIVANRFDDFLTDVKEKVYTRDIYNNN